MSLPFECGISIMSDGDSCGDNQLASARATTGTASERRVSDGRCDGNADGDSEPTMRQQRRRR